MGVRRWGRERSGGGERMEREGQKTEEGRREGVAGEGEEGWKGKWWGRGREEGREKEAGGEGRK